MKIYVRYDTPSNECKGLTRRAYYEQMGANLTEAEKRTNNFEEPPELEIPESGVYLWNLYFDLDRRIDRYRDGFCKQIPPSDFLAWVTLTQQSINSSEFEILCAMDIEFCTERNKEIEANRNREFDRQRAEAEQNMKRGKRR